MRTKQLSLAVRIYHVEIRDGAASIIRQYQTATRSAAKYALYRELRDYGYWENFFDYLQRKPSVREIRK